MEIEGLWRTAIRTTTPSSSSICHRITTSYTHIFSTSFFPTACPRTSSEPCTSSVTGGVAGAALHAATATEVATLGATCLSSTALALIGGGAVIGAGVGFYMLRKMDHDNSVEMKKQLHNVTNQLKWEQVIRMNQLKVDQAQSDAAGFSRKMADLKKRSAELLTINQGNPTIRQQIALAIWQNSVEEIEKDVEKFMEQFTCPITHHFPTDPVFIVGDAQVYDRSAVMMVWEKGDQRCPTSRLPMPEPKNWKSLNHLQSLPILLEQLKAAVKTLQL